MAAQADVIALVEAAYDVASPEAEWFATLAQRFHAVLRPDDGLIAVQVALDGRAMSYTHLVSAGDMSQDYLGRMQVVAELHEKKRLGTADTVELTMAAVYERMLAKGLQEPATHLLYSEYHLAAPQRTYSLGATIADTFALVTHHLDSNGVTGFMGVFSEPWAASPAERAMYLMLDAHIRAGLRLRRRLWACAAESLPTDGAVLSATGQVLDCDGQAQTPEARESLTLAVQRTEQARTKRLGRGPEALAIWQGLVAGSWSLVEQVDHDGKRLLLAHRNSEQVRDPRGLTNTEMRVVGLVARGYPDKIVAYHLGLAEGTIGVHLAHALSKLRMSRAELVTRLGPSYPQPTFEAS